MLLPAIATPSMSGLPGGHLDAGAGDVHGMGFGGAAGLADLPGNRFGRIAVDVGEVHLGSARGDQPGGRGADP